MKTNHSADQMKRIVKNDLFTELSEKFQGRRLFDTPEGTKTLIISKNSPREKRITLNPDGTLSANPDSLLDLTLRKKNAEVFRTAHYDLFTEIVQAITSRLNQLLGTTNTHHYYYYQSVAGNRQHEVSNAINATARSIITTLGNGLIINPQAIAYAALKSLIPNHVSSPTLRVFGPNATLRHLNHHIQFREQLDQAHAQHPNATTMWLTHVRHPLDVSPPPDPEEILRQARDHFISTYRNSAASYQEPHELILRPVPEPSPQAAWDHFTNLNRMAVNHHHKQLDALQRVARIAAAANASPSYSLIHTLCKNLPYHTSPNLQDNLFIDAFRESQSPKGQNTTVKRLTQTLSNLAVSTSAERHIMYPRIMALGPQATTLDWLEATTVEPHSTDSQWNFERPDFLSQYRPRKFPAPKAKAKANRGSTNSRRTAEALMESQTGREITQAAKGLITVDTVPGVCVTLTNHRTGSAAVSFTKNQDGTITVEHDPEQYWPGNPGLPGPDPDNQPSSAPTSQGLARHLRKDAIRRKLTELGKQNRTGLPKRARAYLPILRIIEHNPGKFPGLPTDQELTRTLQREIAKLTEPSVAALCQQLTGQIKPNVYNIVLNSKDAFFELAQTNPGAASYALLKQLCDPENQPAPLHPGQIVADAKAQLTEDGLEPSKWRRLATTPPELIRAVLNNVARTKQETPALRALIGTKHRPTPEQLAHTVHNVSKGTGTSPHNPYILQLLIE